MKILAFDTCLDKMYVVLRTEKKILTSEVVENTESKYHSAFLISTIKNILRKNNLKPEDLDLIGINIGPGSFTGIRACTTVARVMAQQLGIKAIGVSSLEILSKLGGENPLVALDARKNKAYLWCDNEIKGAVELEQVQEIIKNGSYNVITDDRLQKLLGGTSYQQGNYPLGEILSDLVIEKLDKQSGNWAELLPLYIQPPPVCQKKDCQV